jgi:iron complex outermembrane receptor protein
MSKRIVNKTLSAAIIAVLYAGASYAQETKSTASLDEVVVTGSYIRGTPEDSALPVDVVTAEDLANQGSPTLVQLVKSMPAVSGGSVGESNRFLGNSAGTANINLRGFGALRTLVLLNSRRLATSPNGAFGAVDINLLPTDAIGSIEVLKDGAAATYGSDAVAGVVNFLTRKDLDGVEVGANYSQIQHSDGDYQASISWGKKLDGGNVLLTAGYRKRSEIQASDVDWAVRKGAAGFAQNPLGGWSSGSNPGTYLTGTAAQLGTGTYSPVAGAFLDDGCGELGGVAVAATATASAACRFQFTNFDNLVNEENHYQLFGEANFDLGGGTKFHSELM